jgi:hypothetical protein
MVRSMSACKSLIKRHWRKTPLLWVQQFREIEDENAIGPAIMTGPIGVICILCLQ